MQAISDLGTELVKNGYRKVFVMETYCPKDGGWRCGLVESASMISCPQCGLPHEAEPIGYGYTRRPNVWERWEAPLSGNARLMMFAEVEEAAAIRRHQKQGHERSHHYQKRIERTALCPFLLLSRVKVACGPFRVAPVAVDNNAISRIDHR